MRSEVILGDSRSILKTLDENSIDSMITDPPAGVSFMNKKWDGDHGGRDEWIKNMAEIFRECFRVMKPGAHGLVWSLPRTSHWTGMALEDAGFEIRDRIDHFFGTGFPKNMDIGKAIDKAAGAEREVLEKRTMVQGGGSSLQMRVGERKVVPANITAPATEDEKTWDGWGTALKPAHEDWILIRKPLSEKTVAANVLKWGTGAINIDGCRVKTDDDLNGGAYCRAGNSAHESWGYKKKINSEEYKQPIGRWPANLVLSHSPDCTDDGCTESCPIKELDRQSGSNASRFFYCAKPSPAEKNRGLDGDGKRVNDGRKTKVDNPYQRGEMVRKNFHPTVKPIKLMEYFIELITPPGGKILDPFLGSGTTGVAAENLGFDFVGIEREKGYCDLALARMGPGEK